MISNLTDLHSSVLEYSTLYLKSEVTFLLLLVYKILDIFEK